MIKSEHALRRKLLFLLLKIKKLAEDKTSPRWIVLALDLLITITSSIIAWWMWSDFKLLELFANQQVMLSVGIIFLIRLGGFLFFKIYAHVIRHTSFHDIRRVLLTIGTGSFVLLLINLLARFELMRINMPLAIIVGEFLITFYAMTNLRILIKYLYLTLSNIDPQTNRTLIIGSKDIAVLAKEALELGNSSAFKTIAFVDSKPIKKNRLSGLPLYSLEDFEFLLEKHGISHVVFAKKDILPSEKDYIARICQKADIIMLSAPDIWLNGNISSQNMYEVDADELLNREPINLNRTHIANTLEGKVVVITGAAGSIGSELVRQIAQYKPKNLVLIDQAETPLYEIELELIERCKFKDYSIFLSDILNRRRIEKIFETVRPDIVYHAAAYKHVPMMENNPLEAFHNNVIGTSVLADVSNKFKVDKFVMISTDKAVNPTGIMGATKRIAEIYIQSLNEVSETNFITTRFGNVLNSNGSVIPRFLKQISEGGPVTVTHPDITRFFMTIPEACQLVLEASVMGHGGEIFLFDMGQAVKILDLAKNLIKSTGHMVDKDIKIKFTGLRPGEKLYEELLLEAEANKPTHHPRIMIAEVCKYNYGEIKEKLERFAIPVESQNIMQVVKLMKEMIPSYISNNSIFNKLDKAV